MKHNLISRLAASMLLLCVIPQAFAAVTAASIMDGLRAKFATSKNVEILFTLRNGSENVTGSAYASGASFFFETPQLNVWYDGKTQWAMIRGTGEVNITEPTAEELASTNPFAILSDYSRSYKTRRLADSAGMHRVELTPTAKNTGISKIIVSASIKTGNPDAVSVVFTDGRTINLKVDSFKTVPAKPAAFYRYDKKKYPATEIIDLR